MAVKSDYEAIMFWVNNIADTAGYLREEVRSRLLQEARDELEPNETRWVQLVVTRLPFVSGPATQLEREAARVLQSRPGERVFDAPPPEAPETLP